MACTAMVIVVIDLMSSLLDGSLTAHPLRVTAGTASLLALSMITWRRRPLQGVASDPDPATDARGEVEQRMALVIDGAELGFWDWDYPTGKHHVNQRWLDMLGLQTEDLDHYVGDWDNRIHPDDRAIVRPVINAHIVSGQPYVVEFRMRHKQGHWVWIQGSGGVVEHDKITGAPLRLCGTHQNITARKASEKNLQITYQIINQSGFVVLEWSAETGLPVVFATDNIESLTGYTARQLLETPLGFLDLIHADDSKTFERELREMSGQADDAQDIVHLPYRIVCANGRIKWIQDRKVVIRNDLGQITGYQGLITDITDRLQYEQRLLEAKQQAERATRVKSEFLANMSHEIRTPMNAIVGLVELCLNGSIDARQRNYLERVQTASRALMALIDDILDLSKLEAGKMQLEPTPFVLDELLDQVLSTLEELSKRKGLCLIRPVSDSGVRAVIGDPQRLRQVLTNLIGNAVKFTERGEIRVELAELARDERQLRLQFSISDTGIGMTDEQQSRLFQAFSQGDNSITRNYGGTGLGLVISKQLIEQMGGSISVSSQHGIGSTFSFRVTLGVADVDDIRLSRERQHSGFDTRQLQHIRGARILLVEDNEVNRLVATELLEQVQLLVETAEHGQAALDKLQNNHYDCVLMDVQMPVLDGYQTTRRLRELRHCRSLPVIAMTANVFSDDRARCTQAGMNDFIGKPILPQTLYATLLKWISPKTSTPQVPQPPHPSLMATAVSLPCLYGIDNAKGLQHTAGNTSIYNKVLLKFAENHASSMNEIETALAHGDLKNAKRLIHTLKGLAASLGAPLLHGQLQRIDDRLADAADGGKRADGLDVLLKNTAQEMEKIIASIQTTLTIADNRADRPAIASAESLSPKRIEQQLQDLLVKLRSFDSDADRAIEAILADIDDPDMVARLQPVEKQIAHYQFIDAANDLQRLLAQSNH